MIRVYEKAIALRATQFHRRDRFSIGLESISVPVRVISSSGSFKSNNQINLETPSVYSHRSLGPEFYKVYGQVRHFGICE